MVGPLVGAVCCTRFWVDVLVSRLLVLVSSLLVLAVRSVFSHAVICRADESSAKTTRAYIPVEGSDWSELRRHVLPAHCPALGRSTCCGPASKWLC